MIAEFGHFALILALCLALVQAFVPLVGTLGRNERWMAVARPAAWGQCVFLLVAFVALTHAFLQSDFSLAYVAQHSNTRLPTLYKVTAVWGAHEGSLLLWVLILGLWSVAVAVFSRHLPMEVVARVISVMGMISIGFLLFLLLTSNPFERIYPIPVEGRDLNPLLQDPGLAIHPPMLYMGYVGFSVAFSFAIAALIGGKLDTAWARWSRPWTTLAWAFLTVGIALGSWWAYYELGWGGWWFWDPVENASFMPWLIGTALIHSLAVTEKRGAFKRWTVLLAILAFSLSLLGTFLVRSGVLTSVHAFATDPERGVFILLFLCLVIGGSLLLYAWRAPSVAGGGGFEWISREAFLLGNNMLFAVAAFSVLLGTIYPLIIDALGMGKISVGFPYFNSVFIPLMVPLLVLMGVGPLARWKRHDPTELLRTLWFAAVASVLVGVVVALPARTAASAWVGVSVALALWITFTSVRSLSRLFLHRAGIARALTSQGRSYYGMLVAHFGVALFVVGATVVTQYGIEKDVRLEPGGSIEIAGYSFRFDGVGEHRGPNYRGYRGQFTVSSAGETVADLFPEKRVYLVQQSPMTEAAIDAGLMRDLYVSLGEPLSEGAWSVRVYYKPLIRWIWLGCLLMAFGGVLAVSDPRYRVLRRRAVEAMPKNEVVIAERL